ncbi:ABC transporter ATP-binding protein [Rhodococcus chondri]|uniref:ATP-binding cassette domain-containing protein n=1 Tax=Rhodococcus chondri TaxID=3065941 RepID=A0ABU7JYD7_9NOCA|nr:oligopeptide/dipeptide ABC transporter ATP-binding protein [Rhodococcus sp. CC-R104]MEE2035018.1 ATP-binding cassette domain-containing protein [Rhodococcus sp. CC-R104]
MTTTTSPVPAVSKAATGEPILSIENLTVEYRDSRGRTVHAVAGVSFDLFEGETVGLVGESGCGKSTIAKAVVGLAPIGSGTIRAFGADLASMNRQQEKNFRRQCQMIFQDPISSLNPQRRVKHIVAEGLEILGGLGKGEIAGRVEKMLAAVGLDPANARDRRPHEFSGGQCQRISIARALAVEPTLLVCDEPVSALDVSVQAQILNILQDMKSRFKLTMLFIAHDLAVIKNVSDRIVVMHLGALCESATPDELFENPLHPYTLGLIRSIPRPDPSAEIERAFAVGEVPSPTDPPSGCRFRTRCPLARDVCAQVDPEMVEHSPGHFVACHFPLVDGGDTSSRLGVAEEISQ